MADTTEATAPKPKWGDRDILEAIESFTTEIDGKPYIINAGRSLVRASHSLVRARPEAFRPVKVHFDVEQATAAPGEKRAR